MQEIIGGAPEEVSERNHWKIPRKIPEGSFDRISGQIIWEESFKKHLLGNAGKISWNNLRMNYGRNPDKKKTTKESTLKESQGKGQEKSPKEFWKVLQE